MSDSRAKARDALSAVGGLCALELLLCRITEGPPSFAEVVAALVLAALLAGCWAAGERPVPRTLGRLAPAVAIGLGMQVPPLLGNNDWVTIPVVSVLAVGVFALGPALRGEPRELGPRTQIAIALALGLPAWLMGVLTEGQVPPTAIGLGVLAAIAATLALGRFAAVLLPLALVPAGSSERWTAEGPVPTGPDILLVSIDTLRADAAEDMRSFAWVSERGGSVPAQAAAPWTLPSMASLMTGLEPEAHGAGRGQGGFSGVRAEVPTLAERLSEAGWDTAATAENPYTGPVFGLHRGFARFRHDSADAWAFPTAPYTRDARPLGAMLASRLGLLQPALSGVERRLADARELLQARRERPLFLWIHILDPHLPYTHAFGAPDLTLSEAVRFANTNRTLLGEHPGARTLERLERGYAHEVAVVDAAVLEFLEALPERDRIVVLTSDHGEAFGEHGGWEHGHSMYQELLAIPLAFAGLEPTGLASHTDVVPTLLAALGLDRRGTSGRDLVTEAPRPARSVNTLYGDPTLRAVRVPSRPGADKHIHDRQGSRGFDLDRDPQETVPVASEELAPLLPPVFTGGDAVPLDGGTEESLRALGYLD